MLHGTQQTTGGQRPGRRLVRWTQEVTGGQRPGRQLVRPTHSPTSEPGPPRAPGTGTPHTSGAIRGTLAGRAPADRTAPPAAGARRAATGSGPAPGDAANRQ